MSAKDIERLAAAAQIGAYEAGEGVPPPISGAAIRAILQALREPSEEVIAAGYEELDRDPETSTRCAVCVWQAMIDHLLAE